MKFWMKSNGECGTMDNNGFVPDSVEVTELEYREYELNHHVEHLKSDSERLIEYAKLQGWI